VNSGAETLTVDSVGTIFVGASTLFSAVGSGSAKVRRVASDAGFVRPTSLNRVGCA